VVTRNFSFAFLTTNRELVISITLMSCCCLGIAGALFQLGFIRKLEDSYDTFLMLFISDYINFD
jgi:hypothetical protein